MTPIYNLTYFIAAIDRAMLWYNLWALKQNLHRFNGKKIIYIAVMGHDEGTTRLANLNPDEVISSIDNSYELVDRIKAYLGSDIQWIIGSNSPLGDTSAFMHHMAPMVQSTNPDEVTFYAHSKGVRHPGTHVSRLDPKMGLWTGNLYEQVFQFEAMERKIWNEGYQTFGAFKQDGQVIIEHGPPVSWHYSGAMFWFRNSAFFGRNWSCLDHNRGVTEYMIPRIITTEEAATPCYVNEIFSSSGEFYNLQSWQNYYLSKGSSLTHQMNYYGFNGNEQTGFTFTKHLDNAL